MKRLSEDALRHHAAAWMEAWNAHDISAVLAPFAEAAEFTSPRAAELTGRALVRGRPALEAYWRRALTQRPDLRFLLLDVVCDVGAQTVVVHYVAEAGGRRQRACEIMRFRDGAQVEGEALYGALEPIAGT
ncbi:nuclear transport factor 2 family protein [Zavarzinia sp. CC-PAN008]|uniref:nuclear transport factor 2 family protein n=1 Tax=Zavarzinia sp. CC-PAN008 TaxID=3243332 RepID=UPI003F74A41C